MFLLVENYLLDRFNWSSDRLGIFGKKKALAPYFGPARDGSIVGLYVNERNARKDLSSFHCCCLPGWRPVEKRVRSIVVFKFQPFRIFMFFLFRSKTILVIVRFP